MNFNNVLIFGDSYSTYEGYIPNGYEAYYSNEKYPESGVNDVKSTWWHQLISETDSKLVLNSSWSGTTIGHIGYNGEDCSQTKSFIYRFHELKSNGFFEKNKIDTVFVFGGTNDSWSNAPLGEAKFSDWERQDLYFVLCAIPYFLKSLRDELPDKKIVCIINTGLKEDIKNVMNESCKRFNITAVQLSKIDKISDHPSKKGMTEIKNEILSVFKKQS